MTQIERIYADYSLIFIFLSGSIRIIRTIRVLFLLRYVKAEWLY